MSVVRICNYCGKHWEMPSEPRLFRGPYWVHLTQSVIPDGSPVLKNDDLCSWDCVVGYGLRMGGVAPTP